MIIGITGTFCAGKGTVAKYLTQEYGFKHFSARSLIAEHLGVKDPLIEDLRRGGNELREKFGPGYIADELFRRASQSGEDSAIESLRAPAEIFSLRQKGIPFKVFAVDADASIRFSRLKSQEGAAYNFRTVEEMLTAEKKQMDSTDPTKQNLTECIRRADFLFLNNGDKHDLYRQVEQALVIISKEGSFLVKKERQG